MTDVLMPALSPTMEEGTLAKWMVKVGDQVKSGDVIAEIETDKATMEVEAVDEGVVEAILVPEGTEEVKINTPIARLSGADGGAPPAPSAQAKKPEPAKAEPKPEPSRAPPPKAEAPPPPAQAQEASTGERIFASPLARRLAAQKGVELSQIKGSGPHGRIVRKDVEAFAGGEKPAGKPVAPPSPAPQARAPEPEKGEAELGFEPGSYELVPLDGMKKTIARRMTAAFRDVPHFPLTIDIEIDRLLEARAKLNAALEKEGVKASVNDWLIKAAAAALMRVPDANASYSPQGILRHRHAHIAVAVAIEGGLITPVVRAAEGKGVAQIAREMKDLAERARGRKLKPEEYQGGTFSISNLGMFGITSFASILNEPQGAILSVGAGERRPVVRGEAIVPATVMSVTLTCDHRALDGAIGARWLSAFKAMIEDPIMILA